MNYRFLSHEDFDPRKTIPPAPVPNVCERICIRALTSCNTSWVTTSWLGISVYVFICCLNYVIGYYGIYKGMGWITTNHTEVRIFGDIVTVGWFSLGFICLPWHKWEELTWIRTGDIAGALRLIMWWFGTIAGFFVYGYMGQFTLFQTSLAQWSQLTNAQRSVYGAAFATIGTIVIYWCCKLCPCGKRIKNICNPDMARKVIFIRLFVVISLLFVISYVLCSHDNTCVYHLHHWWFGFVLILLSSATIDNWFDYLLQGIFWTFLIETLFNYELTFGKFFM